MDWKLETRRLILRRFRPEDLNDLYEYLSDPEVVRFEPYPPQTLPETEEELCRRIADDEMIAVELRETGKLIGNLYLGKRDFGARELGFVFNRKFWGHGYAAEAAEALVAFAFRQGVNRVYAECDPLNLKSWRLLERLGFAREAHFKRNVFFHRDEAGMPVWKDTYVYARLNETVIRSLRTEEYGLLETFLYEAIFVPEGATPPPREILQKPELRVYLDGFGTEAADLALVAERNGNVVGAAWTRIMNDYGHLEDGVPSLAISLLPEARGQGIGSRLLRSLQRCLRDKGYEKMSLAVQKANYAVRMYEKAGFRRVDENEEEYLMMCDLRELSE